LWSAGKSLSWDGRRGWPQDTRGNAPPPIRYLAEWEPPKLESAGAPLGFGHCWLLKTSPPVHIMCYHINFGSAASKDIRINRREPPNWGALRPRPLGMERGWPIRNKPPPRMCYHVKFGSFVSNDVCINRREIWARPVAIGTLLIP